MSDDGEIKIPSLEDFGLTQERLDSYKNLGVKVKNGLQEKPRKIMYLISINYYRTMKPSVQVLLIS